MSFFSPSRWLGMFLKECRQLARDRVTLAMIVVIPLAQLVIFGFAINTDPRLMPTLVVAGENSDLTRAFLASLENTGYFQIIGDASDPLAAETALATGEAQFVVNIPSDFSRRLIRGENPVILLEADATDPLAVTAALAAAEAIPGRLARRELQGTLAHLAPEVEPFRLVSHRRYNPEGITKFNIVPGMMGVILTLTMVLMTGLAITRERERGNLEMLLALPLRPLEILAGKIVPYVAIGLVQTTLVLLGARFVFAIPMLGRLTAIYGVFLVFIAANLTVGITLSSLARSQLQAMQMAVFYFLPNIVLSGFFFPFRGMPSWARFLGNLLPLTYFNRLIRGVILKGNDWPLLWPSLWPLLVFTLVMFTAALVFSRKTLD
ncbi:MAG: ABC transporter permease [Planctomycetota bacterium]|jgi:ABC-2 type transport system permease protein|nr:ABC transporter permease [Planctomycetota bacterium]